MIINEIEIEAKIKEVRKKLGRGVPEGEIKEELLRDGYTKEEIATYFFKPHAYDMRSWYLVFAVLLFLSGLWLFMSRGYWLVLVLSGLLFYHYYREEKRLKSLKKPD